jgi:ABC-type phosphonate transport system ATPase subunit
MRDFVIIAVPATLGDLPVCHAIIATVCSSVSVKHRAHKRNVLAVQCNAIARCDSRYRDALLDELTALHNAAKEKRRQELRTELGSLTDRPLKAKPAKVKVKYRGAERRNRVRRRRHGRLVEEAERWRRGC